MTDSKPSPAVRDVVKPKAGLLLDDTPRQGRVTAVADDGLVTAEFDQWPHDPMVITGAADDFTVVHRWATDGPTWDELLPEIGEEFWKLFPDDFADARHRDLCHPLCHQNLMEAVRTAIDTVWARWNEQAAPAREDAA